MDYDSVVSCNVLDKTSDNEIKLEKPATDDEYTSDDDSSMCTTSNANTANTTETHLDEASSESDRDIKKRGKNLKHLSPEQRADRLRRWRERNQQRIHCETPEQRDARERRNFINRIKLANETPEQRSKRLRQLREYQRGRLSIETPEEKERRLSKMKEYAKKCREQRERKNRKLVDRTFFNKLSESNKDTESSDF